MASATSARPAYPARRGLPLIFLALLLLAACDLGAGGSTGAPGTSANSSSTAASTVRTLPALTVVGGPTAGATALQVVQITEYANTLGGFTVIGLARTQGATPITAIKISATIKDKTGVSIGTATDQFLALVVTLPPQVSAPFSITFDTLSGEPAAAEVQATGAPYVAQDAAYPPATGLTTSGLQLSKAPAGSGHLLSGQVKNGGAAAANEVLVLGAAYDARGALVDVGRGAADSATIRPGEDSAFQVRFRRDDVAIAHYETLAVGLAR